MRTSNPPLGLMAAMLMLLCVAGCEQSLPTVEESSTPPPPTAPALEPEEPAFDERETPPGVDVQTLALFRELIDAWSSDADPVDDPKPEQTPASIPDPFAEETVPSSPLATGRSRRH